MREVRLGKSFILVPATLKGLKAMAGHFDDGSVPNPAEWTRADVQPRVPPGTGDVKVLKRYMGDEEAFQWLCACAVYPELHWNLTLHLGTLCMTSGYVGEDRLLRLIRLPWFREGAMPDDIRLSLIRELKRDRLQMIRETIVEALEKKPPPEESFAYDTYQLNLAVHRKMIPGKRRRKLKEIRQAKENLGQRQVVQDYTLLRVLDSATVSPLSFLLPKRLHRLFFRDGIPLFGIKSGIWGALSVLVAAAVFFVFPKPQAPVNIKEQKPFIMKFAHIPAGEFMMGSPEDEPGRGSDENQHKVTLRDFYLQTTEVTQGQWKAIMGENPSYFKNCGNECPVETVSWEDVQKFIERLNQIKG
ncbi:MAG: formylglycine-generating enzyme family protein, partial [Desulfobacteraceae bacterium]|nr:formylglycine-generating enzyme family protein [Desulfobacteraceae bacterium]